MILEDEVGALVAAYLVFSAARIEGVFAFVEASQTDLVLVLIQALAATSCLDKRSKNGYTEDGQKLKTHFVSQQTIENLQNSGNTIISDCFKFRGTSR